MLFDRDAASKLAREHASLDATRRARERERARASEIAASARAERERRERAMQREKRTQREDAERLATLNEGVTYASTLRVEISDEAERRGIRARGDDKARLPGGAADALGAGRSGRAHFSVEASNGRTCHVGVLDYGGVSTGMIGIPRPMLRSLGLRETDVGAEVRVTYAALPSATRMTLKPKTNEFARACEAEENVRDILERTMMGRSAATVGDEIEVTVRDATYDLRVVRVEPDDGHGAVSLLETDVEVDLEPSDEYDEFVSRERRRKEEFERAKEALAEREREKETEKLRAAERRRALLESIVEEPPSGSSVVTLRLNLPNGAVKTRRFDRSRGCFVRDVFDYARSVDDDLMGARFILTTRQGDVVLRDGENVDAADAARLHAQTFFVRRDE